MVDDRTTPLDRTRINLLQDWEVHFWCRTFDVSPAQLRNAIQHVGPQVDAVKRYLADHRPESND